jgi:hypothetical protein
MFLIEMIRDGKIGQALIVLSFILVLVLMVNLLDRVFASRKELGREMQLQRESDKKAIRTADIILFLLLVLINLGIYLIHPALLILTAPLSIVYFLFFRIMTGLATGLLPTPENRGFFRAHLGIIDRRDSPGLFWFVWCFECLIFLFLALAVFSP